MICQFSLFYNARCPVCTTEYSVLIVMLHLQETVRTQTLPLILREVPVTLTARANASTTPSAQVTASAV